MAASFLRVCSICEKPFDDPRILPCLHSFCLKCIVSIKEENSVTCPTCSHVTALPDDVRSLQCNTWLRETSKQYSLIRNANSSQDNSSTCVSCGETVPTAGYCVDCNGRLCTSCLQAHKRLKGLSSHKALHFDQIKSIAEDPNEMKASLPSAVPMCLTHKEVKLDLYCNTCKALVCVKCAIGTHRAHDVTELSEDQAGQSKDQLQKSVDDIASKRDELEKARLLGTKVKEKVKELKKMKDDEIEQAFLKLHQAVDERKRVLLANNCEICASKDVRVSIQLESLEKLLHSIEECRYLASNDYSLAHFLSIADTLSKRAVHLKQQIALMSFDVFEVPTILLESNESTLVPAIEEFGCVFEKHPTSFSTAILPRKNVAVGVEMKVRVISCDANDRPLCKGGAKVRGMLFDGPTDNQTSTSCPVVVDCNDGIYIVSVTLQQLGSHQLYITINSQSIKGSPFQLTGVEPLDYTKIKDPAQVIGLDCYVNFIAFSENGDIFVTSESADKIFILDKNGEKKSTIGSKGKGELQFDIPNGIAINNEVIYVAEYNGNRIQKITTGGIFLGSFGEKGSKVGQFDRLWAVEVSPDGKLYVADWGNNCIQIFSCDWNVSSDAVCSHVANIDVNSPVGLAFDLDGNVHVTTSTGGVRVFSPSDEYIRCYGDKNSSYYSIAIDSSGQSLITDNKNNCLVVYDQSGVLVHSIKGLNQPYGVTISPADGSVWVADLGNNRLVKYFIE